jgi:indolepyruvate ferredoxin oxidoreductase beta subunit
MQKNIILAGVGGQGILSIAYVIDNAALDVGFHFKQAEVHGMAQRGGAVQSNLRYGDGPIHSDLVPTGQADLVLSVEPLEVMRYWHYLSPGGWAVSSVTPYVNIPDYPELDRLIQDLAEFGRVVLVDSSLIARAAGNLRAQNMVMVGAAAPLLGFPDATLEKYVAALFAGKGQKTVDVNISAFRLGRVAGLFFRGLVDGGLGVSEALRLSAKIDPKTVDPAHAPAWAAAILGDRRLLEQILAGESAVPCDRVAAPA